MGRAGQWAGTAPTEEEGQAKWTSGQDQFPGMELGQWEAAEVLHILSGGRSQVRKLLQKSLPSRRREGQNAQEEPGPRGHT